MCSWKNTTLFCVFFKAREKVVEHIFIYNVIYGDNIGCLMLHQGCFSQLKIFFFFFFFFVFRGHIQQHIKVPRLRVKLDLAIADLSCICNLYHSSLDPYPLSEARNKTCVLMDGSQICFCWALMDFFFFLRYSGLIQPVLILHILNNSLSISLLLFLPPSLPLSQSLSLSPLFCSTSVYSDPHMLPRTTTDFLFPS